MISKIAVIGATGMLGKPVTRQLINAGFDVTLLARDTAKAKKMFTNAKVVQADIFQPATLQTALQNMDAVYINLGPPHESRKKDPMPEREGLKNVLEAAVENNLKRVLFISSLVQNYNGMNDFHWWIFDMKWDAVELVKRSSVPSTIFYPSTFMETVEKNLIRGNKLMLTSGSIAPMWFISGDDYGKQVAQSIKNNSTGNQEYIIQGTQAYTWDQAAKVIVENSKKPLKIMKAPIGVLKLMSMFSPKMSYAYHICEALNKYPEKFDGNRAWEELGKPSVSLAEFAAREIGGMG